MYTDLNCPKISFPLDTIEDWKVLDKICKNFDNFDFSFKDIVEYIKKNPKIINLNNQVERKGLK